MNKLKEVHYLAFRGDRDNRDPRYINDRKLLKKLNDEARKGLVKNRRGLDAMVSCDPFGILKRVACEIGDALLAGKSVELLCKDVSVLRDRVDSYKVDLKNQRTPIYDPFDVRRRVIKRVLKDPGRGNAKDPYRDVAQEMEDTLRRLYGELDYAIRSDHLGGLILSTPAQRDNHVALVKKMPDLDVLASSRKK